ncbi:MAG: hypothetical protein PHQ23_03210 [Candidatus Wallbacteria bacterium]|nr:hypothetical protein [Candidatus Wallbacteria bacterium]
MKILYIAHFLPPLKNSEAKNNFITVTELKKNGFEPVILTSEGFRTNRDNTFSLDGFQVSRYDAATVPKKLPDALNPRTYLRLPDLPLNLAFRKQIVAAGRRLVAQNDIRAIYAVFGTGSEHLAAADLAGMTGLPLILEYRDPWIHNGSIDQYMRDKFPPWYYRLCRKKMFSLQKYAVSRASLLLVESGYNKLAIERDFGHKNVVLNYVGYHDFERDKIKDDAHQLVELPKHPVIGFIGNTYYGCETYFERILKCLCELENEGLEFTFVSVGENIFNRRTLSLSMKQHLPVSLVDFRKAQGFTSLLDWGLSILSYPNLNSKIFDYISFGIPTLHFSPEGKSVRDFFAQTGVGFFISADNDSLKESLRKYLTTPVFKLAPEIIARFSRQATMVPVLEAINKLIR